MSDFPIVTFTTEYGDKSPYTGALKGLLLQTSPRLNIQEISNAIRPNDILTAAYLVRTACSSFPKGSIHLIGVDFNPVKYPQILIIRSDGMYYVMVDNGLASLVFKGKPCEVFALKQDAIAYSEVFPEASFFPYITGRLLNKEPLDDYTNPSEIITVRDTLSPRISEAGIKGTIVFVDGYENVITDIQRSDFEPLRQRFNGFSILYRRKNGITKISGNYEAEKSGDLLAVFNHFGYLELAIREGNAKSLLGLETGGSILIEFYD